MNSKTEVNQLNVMSRMEWFRDLKLIFNKLVTEEDILAPADKSQILKELVMRSGRLDLKDPVEYYAKSKVQAFSLAEIVIHITSLQERSINFDQLIDSLIYLSIDKKRKEKDKDKIVKEKEKEKEKEKIPSGTAVSIMHDNKPAPRTVSTPSFKEGTEFNLKEVSKEYQHTIIKLPSSSNSSILDLSYPSKKLDSYPELKNHPNLLQLSLAGNSITHTKYKFPTSLQVLNLSSNRISELRIEINLENLVLLNLTSNHICSISNINYVKNIRELYIANNCITSLNMLCHLASLLLVDCSHNDIETFEDIAGLVISKRVGILKLRGNPISSKMNYEQVVASILPRIYCLDPLNIIELSSFRSLGSLPFLPIKNLLEEAEEKTEKQSSDVPFLSSIKSESNFGIRKFRNNSDAVFTPNEKVQNKAVRLSATPVGDSKNHQKMKRSASLIRVDKSQVLTNTSKAPMSFTASEEPTRKATELESSGSIMDMAERRIKVFQSDRSRSSISIISNESIHNVKKVQYGNPVAAMMIGPPAVSHLKARVPSKSPACYSLDLSKKRKK